MSDERDPRPDAPPIGILDGMRVIEVSAFVAAPLGGMTLAQLGADVIRVDPPGGGIDYRRWPLALGGQSLYWSGLNKGKRSVALDLASEEGQRIAARLATAPGEGGGLFLTNLPARGPLAYEALRAVRPDLIMVSVTGDPDGTSQVDYTVNAATGYPWLTGPPDADGPINSVLPAWDIATGTLAAVALLAGERSRFRTGRGRLIEIALSDVALAMVANLGRFAASELGAAQEEREGNHLYGAFGHDFSTRDGQRLMVVAITPRQWTALVRATATIEPMEALERAMGLDLRTESDRYAARERIVGLLAPWFADRDLSEIRECLTKHHATWAPYQTISEMVAHDPRASLANSMFAEVEHPGVGRYRMPASPLRITGSQRAVRRAPILGEHTDEILTSILGMSRAELAILRDARIVA
ncbi:MAG: CoA transferase [Chloroflexi bacterium]|nr:CoA transferase [Chloroflexota bacterium]